jgi:phosphohistidine swiveling domain-containing protein
MVAPGVRLPAVVGCDVATSAIVDGARIEVNGDSGQVRLVVSGCESRPSTGLVRGRRAV